MSKIRSLSCSVQKGVCLVYPMGNIVALLCFLTNTNVLLLSEKSESRAETVVGFKANGHTTCELRDSLQVIMQTIYVNNLRKSYVYQIIWLAA